MWLISPHETFRGLNTTQSFFQGYPTDALKYAGWERFQNFLRCHFKSPKMRKVKKNTVKILQPPALKELLIIPSGLQLLQQLHQFFIIAPSGWDFIKRATWMFYLCLYLMFDSEWGLFLCTHYPSIKPPEELLGSGTQAAPQPQDG